MRQETWDREALLSQFALKRSVHVLPCLLLICLDGLLEKKKKNQIIGKLNGGVAVTMGSITDRTLALLAFG